MDDETYNRIRESLVSATRLTGAIGARTVRPCREPRDIKLQKYPTIREARSVVLFGRAGECRELDTLLESVRQGASRALVVRGDAGVGKSSLLDYLEQQAAGCRVQRAVGVQSEMELPFAGVHQLCAPLLDRMDALPPPQLAALKTAFGLDHGPTPDQLMVNLAVLGLLADQPDARPLVCLVDDVQWLDRASAQALTFVARRIAGESIALVFATA